MIEKSNPIFARTTLLENRVFIGVRTSIDIITGCRMKAKGPLLMIV